MKPFEERLFTMLGFSLWELYLELLRKWILDAQNSETEKGFGDGVKESKSPWAVFHYKHDQSTPPISVNGVRSRTRKYDRLKLVAILHTKSRPPGRWWLHWKDDTPRNVCLGWWGPSTGGPPARIDGRLLKLSCRCAEDFLGYIYIHIP